MYFGYGFDKGRGTGRIIRELAGKGIPRSLIDRAYSELDEKPDEHEMALAIAERIIEEAGADVSEMSFTEKQKLQAKIVRRLASRGFDGGLSYSVAREKVR